MRERGPIVCVFISVVLVLYPPSAILHFHLQCIPLLIHCVVVLKSSLRYFPQLHLDHGLTMTCVPIFHLAASDPNLPTPPLVLIPSSKLLNSYVLTQKKCDIN